MSVLKTLYRTAINLAPSRYRAAYGDEQWRLFELVLAEERPRTRVSRMVWSVELVARAFLASAQVHRDYRRARRRERNGVWGSMRGGGSMGSDVRFTLRSVKASPWYAIAIIGVTAVTMTLATTTFAIVDGVLFRPLPYPDARSLVTIEADFASIPRPATRDGLPPVYGVSEVDIRNWQAAVPEAAVTGFRAQGWSGLGEGVNESASGVGQVQANFFSVLGVSPLFGGFTPQDFQNVVKVRPVIMTYDLWMSRYLGAADILGREVVTNPVSGSGFRVVGVMPKGFSFPSVRADVKFLTPFVNDPKARENPAARMLTEVIARPPQGMALDTLRDRLSIGVVATAALFPPQGPKPQGWSDNGWRRQGPYDAVRVSTLSGALSRASRGLFSAVFAAVVLLVLIAAANVSSLMGARALERQQEVEVRRSLGASGWAVTRLWTLEAATLMIAGALIGAGAAPLLIEVMARLLPDTVVLLKPAQMDWRVGAFVAMTLAVLVPLVAIAPVRRSLALTGRAVKGATARTRTPASLIVIGTQVAVAFVLTVGGTCLVGSLLAVYANELPIRTKGVVAIDVMLQGPGATMDVSPERVARADRLRERLARIPGVSAVAATSAQVLQGGGAMTWFDPPAGSKHPDDLDTWSITDGFYEVLQPDVIEGRVPTSEELRSHAPVIAISQRVARSHWPDRSALGEVLFDHQTKQPFTIVGIVKDVRWQAWDMESPVIYAPYASTGRAPWITFFLRTEGNMVGVTRDALSAMQDTDAMVRPSRAASLDTLFRDSVSIRRFQSWLFGGFAAASLIVVGAGILGLLAMSTARRTKEVGIRCALGATPHSVVALLIREQAVAVTAGLVCGGVIAAWAVRFVKGYLYELAVTDPRIWAAATCLVLATALAGTFIPSWRASRIDPLKALRVE